MQERKPRTLRIGLAADKLGAISGIQLSADGALTFVGQVGNDLPLMTVSSGFAYDRDRKPQKVTVEIFDHSASAGTPLAALTHFTRVLAVDTNSKTIDGELVCVSTVAKLQDFYLNQSKWSCRYVPLWSWEFHGAKEDAEKIGWRDALLRCEELGWLTESERLLLVVDSHLGELRDIARRSAPVLRNYMLPLRASLAYASSDVTDPPLTSLISICDHIAQRLLDAKVRATILQEPLAIARNQPFDACRSWTWTDVDGA